MIKSMLRVAVVILLFGLFCVSSAWAANWQDRVLPLPQEMEIEGSARVRAGEISYEIRVSEEAPVYRTVRELLGSFALGGEGGGGEAEISFVLAGERPGELPPEISGRLSGVPNAEQAYAVYYEKGEPLKITVAANTPVGLLYGAQTFTRLVKPGEWVSADSPLEIPLPEIVDWPDIAQRGEWGDMGYSSWGWNARWNMNMWKLGTHYRLNPARFSIRFLSGEKLPEFTDWAERLNISLVPYIGHLGHLSVGRAGGGPEWTEISPGARPDDSRPAHYTRQPGFCWADREIHRVLEDYIREMASFVTSHGGRDVEVWLTEYEDVGCHCDECADKDNYIQETLGAIGAYERVREEYPGLRLRIALSQGTHQAKEAIVETVSLHEDVGINYYDGIRGYYADRRELIFPELEEFARAGGLADVIPVLTPCYYSLYPASMPQYVRFRAGEFAGKNLHAVTAYSQGGQFYWPLNVAAWGEYTWNAAGRPVRDFARAYATIEGIADPDLFASWAENAGEAAWELATSRYMDEMARGNYARLPSEIGDGEFQEQRRVRAGRALEYAREALRLAREAGDPMMLAESEVTLAGLKSIRLRHDIIKLLSETGGSAAVSEKLVKLDICGQLIHTNVHRWYENARDRQRSLETAAGYVTAPEIIFPLPEELLQQAWPANRHSRQAYGVLRAADTEWQMALIRGAPDKRGMTAPFDILDWEEDDFDRGEMRTRINVSSPVPAEGGRFNLGLNMLTGSCRIDQLSMRAVVVDPRTGREEITNLSSRGAMRWAGINSASPRNSWYDRRIMFPARKEGEELFLEILLCGDGSGGGAGYATLRAVWSRDDFPEEKIDMLLK